MDIDETLGTQGGQESTGGPPSDQPIKIGDREYSPDELTELVKKGEYASGIEKDQNIDIKELYPEYTRSRQKIREFETQLDSAQNWEAEEPGGEDDYSGEVDLTDEVRSLRAELNEFKTQAQKSQASTYEREVTRELAALEEKHGVKLGPLDRQHILSIAMWDKNMDLGEAMEIYKLKKERDDRAKEQAKGLGGTGQSPAQGVRKYDPKKSREENFREAKEDFLKLRGLRR